ncbi:ferritin-like domain-containing protein [Bacillaceae bacterium S4-13-56]
MSHYYYPYGLPIQDKMDRNMSPSKAKFNIPYSPLLGDQSQPQLIKNVHKAIVDEATAANFYARLLKEAPDELNREFVQHAYEDELEHLQAFIQLYIHLTGRQPEYQMKQIQYSHYKEGILKALKDELEAVEFYRDVKLSTCDPLVQDTFFFAMVDELEHGTQFGVLLNML